jgi:hypothetical protein
LSYPVSSHSDGRRSPALDSVGNLIKEQHSDLLISKQKLERAKGIELVRIKREQRIQDLCFSSRPFVLCGLPVRRLPNDRLLYERRNGRFVLQITGHPELCSLWTGSTRAHISSDSRGPTEESDNSLPHCR